MLIGNRHKNSSGTARRSMTMHVLIPDGDTGWVPFCSPDTWWGRPIEGDTSKLQQRVTCKICRLHLDRDQRVD